MWNVALQLVMRAVQESVGLSIFSTSCLSCQKSCLLILSTDFDLEVLRTQDYKFWCFYYFLISFDQRKQAVLCSYALLYIIKTQLTPQKDITLPRGLYNRLSSTFDLQSECLNVVMGRKEETERKNRNSLFVVTQCSLLMISLSCPLLIHACPGSRFAYFWQSKLGHGYVAPTNLCAFCPKRLWM